MCDVYTQTTNQTKHDNPLGFDVDKSYTEGTTVGQKWWDKKEQNVVSLVDSVNVSFRMVNFLIEPTDFLSVLWM